MNNNIANNYNLCFHNLDLTRLGVWVLDGDPAHSNLLKYALNETNYEHTLVILTVSMTTPWNWQNQLQTWIKILCEHVNKLDINDGRKYYIVFSVTRQ